MRGKAILLACVLLLPSAYAQDDAYYSVRLSGLELTEGKLPDELHRWPDGSTVRVVLDGPGEAYVAMSGINRWQPNVLLGSNLVVRAPAGKEVTGLLTLPGAKVRFKIPATAGTAPKTDFEQAKRSHLEYLRNERFAGAGHWIHLLHEMSGRHGIDERRLADPRMRRTEVADTYEFLTGGRAVAENLQLRRGLVGGARDEEKVAIDTLQGITIQEFDWSTYIEGKNPGIDPLAACIPADQFAVFFPTFDAMMRALDSAEENGTPALQAMEERAEDAGTKQKYENQLCLQTSALARLLGPKLVNSVAFTGSDPFLREGTDVAILFEAKDADALETLLKANRMKNAAGVDPKATVAEREVEGVKVHAITGANRIVHSLQVRLDGVVIVSNSMAQITRLVGVKDSIAGLDEYKFFRSRYPRDGETAFVILTDGAIRRWCGPKWRIAMSRRLRAAAALAALEAEQYQAMAKGEGIGAKLANDFPEIDCGEITLTERGATSSIYGNPRFLTPIAELEITHVTEAEAAAYRTWRNDYQHNWSRYFDPIAAQLKIDDNELAVDTTVMPLIVASEYNTFIRVAGESKIRAGAGDPHPEALFQFIFAFDHGSEAAQTFGRAFPSWPGIRPRTNPLRWIGESISFSIDRDPFFEDAAKAKDGQDYVEKNLGRLPLLLRVDVVDPLVAGLFMAGLRTYMEGTAPGYTKWTTRKHGDIEYVRVEAGDRMTGEFSNLAIHYATLKGALLVGINEEVFQRAIDRHEKRVAEAESKAKDESGEHAANGDGQKGGAGAVAAKPAPKWLGDHVAGRAHRDIFRAFEAVAGDDGYRALLQARAWKNIPILNEWRLRFPGEDPVKMHERLTGIRLVCPGGGTYVWNDAWKTYESTVFGHSGDPKRGPDDILPFRGWNWGSFGVTFEKEGIRARASISK